MKQFNLSIHIFRRDLRLDDNSALMAALEQSEQVLPVFIFDPRQLEHTYRGNNSFQFMLKSLAKLDGELRKKGSQLFCFKGIAHEVLAQLIESTHANAVFINRDYTPFSRNRDEEMAKVCQDYSVSFNVFADALLNEPEEVSKDDGKPYTIFTPFMKKARQNSIRKPTPNIHSNFYIEEVKLAHQLNDYRLLFKHENPNLLPKGGRSEALSLLQNLNNLHNYDNERNLPSVKGTSLLSAHHKFGTISVRETYWKIA
ncbi:MAG TPA: deoxyribodipyrimidine photo-lyase, partial [Prolixibacteraceae bacterium]|nr:deoxyribodipyrimidine photo-lyase [Prolixibacteraceae bacterium]